MTTLAAPSNRVHSTIATGNSYVRGTDTDIVLTDGTNFTNDAQLIQLTYETHWCLLIYTSKAGDTITLPSTTSYGLAQNVSSGDDAYTWPAGTIVELIDGADIIKQLLDDKLEKSLYDAQSILAAVSDNTPVVVTVAEQRLVGRITDGDIAALTAAQVLALINVADGADVTGSNAPQAHKDSHDPNNGSDALDTAAAAEISAVVAAGIGTSHSLARADHVHAISHGITDNHIATIDDADAADNDYAKFTVNGLEGRSYAEVLGDLTGANLDVGAFDVRGQTLTADVAIGTAPLVITSTTVVANLNVDQVDGKDASDFVWDSLFDANTILKADSDNTPAALTVAEQRLVGRITSGVITALTAAQVNTLLGTFLADGSVEMTGAFTQQPLSSDPGDPDAGNWVWWVSDGTDSFDAGDVCLKVNVSGTVKTFRLIDYSAH